MKTVHGVPVERIGGYTGQILWVDLTTGDIHTLSTYDYADYIGGRAMGAKLQWDFGEPGITDGKDPRSLLMFLTGPLNGVPFAGSGKMTVCFQQTLQNPGFWSHSSAGGWFAPELKQAGYDGIIVKGRAEKPSYLWIKDGKAEIRDASDIWELNTYQTQERIRTMNGGDHRIRIACIGPSGAKGNRMSAILFDTSHAAGQHPGAVMGSKNLKAIAVRGDAPIKVADPSFVFDFRRKHMAIHEMGFSVVPGGVKAFCRLAGAQCGADDVKRVYSCYGCHFGYYPFIDLPNMPKGGNICGVTQEYSTAKGTYEKKLQWKHTPYGDAYTEPQRFEYTMGSGDPKLMQDLMSIVKLLDLYGVSLYELLGMRTPNNLLNYMCLSPKVSPGFRQWLEHEVGAPYGTMDFGRKYAELVGNRIGAIGEWMGDGVERAAIMLRDHPEKFGMTKEDAAFAWESYQRCYPIHGSFEHHFYRPTMADPRDPTDAMRVSPIAVFCYCLGSRQMGPSHHAVTEMYEESQLNSRGHAYKVFFDERAACRYLDANGEPLIFGQPYLPDLTNYYTLDGRLSTPVKPNFTKGLPLAVLYAMAQSLYNDSMVTCDFLMPMVGGSMLLSLLSFDIPKLPKARELLADPEYASKPEWSSEQFSAVTGIHKSMEEFYQMGWRALTLERAIHVRDGNRARENDRPNAVTMARPDAAGVNIDEEEWKRGLAIVYELFGWDPETGVPTEKGLHKYGLDDVAAELEKLGKLSHTEIDLNLAARLIEEGRQETEKNQAYFKRAWEERESNAGIERSQSRLFDKEQFEQTKVRDKEVGESITRMG